MNEQHTKGPWFRKAGISYSVEIVNGDGEPIAIADIGRDECEDNASLIAAAPELLDVLLAIEKSLQAGHEGNLILAEFSPIRSGISEVIAKATA